MRRTISLPAISLAAVLTIAASSMKAAAADATGPAPPSPPAEIGLGTLQIVTGYVAEGAGLAAVLAAGLNPKRFGAQSDLSNLVLIGALVPTFAGGAVCATGLISHRYRARCVPTFLGAYAGALVGGLIGVLAAPAPGPDDTKEFMQAMTGMVGVLLMSPIGAVIGYHLGKEPIAAPATGVDAGPIAAEAPITPVAATSLRDGFTAPLPRALWLPVVDVRW